MASILRNMYDIIFVSNMDTLTDPVSSPTVYERKSFPIRFNVPYNQQLFYLLEWCQTKRSNNNDDDNNSNEITTIDNTNINTISTTTK